LQLTSVGTVVEPMTIEGMGREMVRWGLDIVLAWIGAMKFEHRGKSTGICKVSCAAVCNSSEGRLSTVRWNPKGMRRSTGP